MGWGVTLWRITIASRPGEPGAYDTLLGEQYTPSYFTLQKPGSKLRASDPPETWSVSAPLPYFGFGKKKKAAAAAAVAKKQKKKEDRKYFNNNLQ